VFPGHGETATSNHHTLVHRAPNHTLSWLLGEPIERLTICREVAGAELVADPRSVHRDVGHDPPVDALEDLVEVGTGDRETVVALADHGP
jgi:hypothetical protein